MNNETLKNQEEVNQQSVSEKSNKYLKKINIKRNIAWVVSFISLILVLLVIRIMQPSTMFSTVFTFALKCINLLSITIVLRYDFIKIYADDVESMSNKERKECLEKASMWRKVLLITAIIAFLLYMGISFFFSSTIITEIIVIVFIFSIIVSICYTAVIKHVSNECFYTYQEQP